MRWRPLLAVSAVILACLVATAVQAATAPFQVLFPTPAATVPGPSLPVVVRVTGAVLRPPGSVSGSPQAAVGYLTLQLDGQPPVTVVSNESLARYTFDNVAVGNHTLVVRLLHENGAAWSPPAVATMRVTVTAAPPTPTLTVQSPAQDQVVGGSTVEVRLAVSNLRLVPPGALVALPGQGYLAVSVDGAKPFPMWFTHFSLPQLRPGWHRLTITLMSADKTPYRPAVTATVNFRRPVPLWWWLLGLAVVAAVGAAVRWALPWWRRRRERGPQAPPTRRRPFGW